MNEVIASLASPVQASTKNCSKSGHEKKVENGSDEFPNNEVQIEREKDVKNPDEEDQGELNQEDIEAVEFLASEFSKEAQTAKTVEHKEITEMETVDSTMLEVASVQGVNIDCEQEAECSIIDSATTSSFEVTNDVESTDSLTQSMKRKKTKGEDREFKCGFCSKSFTMRIALEKHLVVHGAKLPWQCRDCAKGFMKSSDYKEHCNKVHDNFRPFPCHICGKTLSNLGILKNHQGLHTGERPFQCTSPGCGKSFLTKTNLEDHLRKHLNAREFKCEICQKRFNLKGDLRQHEKVHRQEKPFECEFCKMTFPRGPSLWRHRRTHTGEKPYACDLCGKRFARMENCQEHRRIHTGERPLVCKVCGKTFRDSGNFSNHKKIHEDGYVPRKKRPVNQKKAKTSISQTIAFSSASNDATDAFDSGGKSPATTDVSSQEVAFIVAPVHVDDTNAGICMSTTATTSEPSYVQVGNFLLTMEMESAFKQLMQQHGTNSEFVTLAMTNGKGLELVSDPSQFGAIMQAAAIESQAVVQSSEEMAHQGLTVALISAESEQSEPKLVAVESAIAASESASFTEVQVAADVESVATSGDSIATEAVSVSTGAITKGGGNTGTNNTENANDDDPVNS